MCPMEEKYKEKKYTITVCEYELLFLYELLKKTKPQQASLVDKVEKIITKNKIINWMDPKWDGHEEELIKQYFKGKGE